MHVFIQYLLLNVQKNILGLQVLFCTHGKSASHQQYEHQIQTLHH